MKPKQTYQELEKKAAFFQTLADNSYDWEMFVDLAGEIKYISPSCELISGYSANEFIENPKLLSQIIHQSDKEIVGDHFVRKLKNTAETISLAYRIITKNGDIKWIEHNCKKAFDKSNKNIGYSSSNRDITERQNEQNKLINTEKELTIAKEKAEESEAKFKQLSNLTFEGILLTQNGIASDINLSFSKMFGYTREEIIGKNLLKLLIKEEYHNMISQNIIKNYALPYEQYSVNF